MEKAKVISTSLTTHLKLSVKQIPSNEVEKTYMGRVSYAYVVDNLIYAIVCIKPDIARVFGIISQFLSNSNRDHYNTIK